jgi:hypothetical protein
MNSRFLKICEQVKRGLNEQDASQSLGQSISNDPTATLDPQQPSTNQEVMPSSDEKSQLPVATNKDIVSAVKSIKNFYAQKKQLSPNDIDRIKMLSDDESDENINKIIKTLNGIFNPVDTIDTNPQNVPNSDFEKNN